TGFKGSWLCLWLQHLGANVTGFALSPPTIPNLFEQAEVAGNMTSIIGDICDLSAIREVMEQTRPEIVFHLAAQALLGYSYHNPIETYQTNVMGTLNVLENMRSCGSVRSALMVTSDKCYENKEWLWGYRENDALGGYDPYSSSKACAEILISSYRNSYFPNHLYHQHKTAIASARAGNVIGGGDFADDRLIPDIIRALVNKEMVNIRNPTAIRPWQHVLEPLSGYLQLAEKLYTEGIDCAEGWNFASHATDAKPVEWIVQKMLAYWGENKGWKIENSQNPHEAHYLKLDCSKAMAKLNWQPHYNLENALEKTVSWYKAEQEGVDMKAFTLKQIMDYQERL
ncbi:MAG: CDP-glucose 4,6-dehydratase, partial [Chryseobacterium sp.]